MLKIGEQSVASILRQRQPDLAPPFAADPQRCLVPFDVAKAHCENIAGSQTEARQEEQDRPVADAMRRG
jgi:hypothetical protein